MLRWLESRVLWGALLILGGVVFLLENLGLVSFGELFWGILIGLAGIFFLAVFLGNRSFWWALIPGFTLLGVSCLIVLNRLFPRLGDAWGGGLVLGGIGLGFLGVYLSDRNHWWAVIPGGVMATLAVVSGLGERVGGLGTGGLFFLGIGLTFAVLALVPTPQGQMRWAWIPAGILVLMGLLFSLAAEELIGYIWPLGLIAAGLLFLYRAFVSRLM